MKTLKIVEEVWECGDGCCTEWIYHLYVNDECVDKHHSPEKLLRNFLEAEGYVIDETSE